MKNIVFKKISIKNFLSIGDTPVVVDFKSGLNIITGSNKDKDDSRNGVGKSTIADAIFYAVFGNTLRDIKKENVSNDSYKGNCEIQLFLDIVSPSDITNIHIVRTLDPSRAVLYINGMDKTLDSIASTNEAIGQMLNCNPEVFENCVIMTLNNALPFMCRKKQDKRKFIESIFNLEVFSKMLSNVKVDYADNKNQLEVEVAKKNQADNTIKSLKDQEIRANQEKQIKINKLLSQIKEADARRAGLKDKQEKLDLITLATEKQTLNEKLLGVEPARLVLQAAVAKIINKKKELSDNIIEIRVKEAGLNGSIISARTSLDKINTSQPTCPACLREIGPNDVQHIEEEKQKIQNKLSEDKQNQLALGQDRKNLQDLITIEEASEADINKRLQKLNGIELDLQSKINKITQIESESGQLQQKIDLIEAELKGHNDSIRQVEDNNSSFNEVISKQLEANKEIEKTIVDIKSKLEILDKVKFVFSEEGVKSFLVKQILDLFNNRLGYYLKKMDANCICTFNEYFEETIINDKSKNYSYYNFSGAERKKLDLACLFTFMDIRRLQGDVSFNISLYDELLDSSLDAKGVELVVDILKERVEKYNESIYIISHRKESTKLATGDVIYLQKNNGITTRLDFQQSPV